MHEKNKREKEIETIAKVALLIFLYYVVYAFFIGIFISPVPAQGDSWDYHIPISKSILNGSFINPSLFSRDQYFPQLNPGSSEAINSIFLLLNIPLTISNLFAAVVLFFCLWKLALTFQMKKYYALLFALSFSTLNVIVRWHNSVSIDVWIAVFFTLAIILLENPKKTLMYFLKLGFVFGMLIGSKYSGLTMAFILILFYGRSLLRAFSVSRVLVFLIPFSIFGVFWYVRNYLAVGNPMWPICVLWFPCKNVYEIHAQMWDTTIKYPLVMLNAFFSEYKVWSLSFLLPLFVLFLIIKKKLLLYSKITLLCLIGIANFLFFLKFPTSAEPWVMVSSFRYSFTIFIPLMLATFLLVQKYQRENLLGYIAIASMINILTMAYYPKLVLLYFPLWLLFVYFLDKKSTEVAVSEIEKTVTTKRGKTKKRKNNA